MALRLRHLLALLCAALTLTTCSRAWHATFVTPDELGQNAIDAAFIKVHLDNGSVVVLSQWTIDESGIKGTGRRYNLARSLESDGPQTVARPEVALVETNTPEKFFRTGYIVLGIVTAASIATTIGCAAAPKACFGSCPTFYVDGREAPLAEGFSSAVARALEDTDVDALGVSSPGGAFTLTMRNEAQETHAVKSLALLAVPAPKDATVVRVGDGFWAATQRIAPSACRGAAGECTQAVVAADDAEYHAPTDPDDLGKRERLAVSFPASRGHRGLLIRARHSLVSTYVFYQLLAYMGWSAGEFLMRLERGGEDASGLYRKLSDALGAIEVEVKTPGRGWVKAGKFWEVGPIAKETQVVALPDDAPEANLEVRVALSQGAWKIDQLAVVELGAKLEATRVKPASITSRDGVERDALAALGDPARHWLTFPGSEYALHFDVPRGPHELFLESRGYYYEWIRREWLRETDPSAAVGMLRDPEGALKRLARGFKSLEPGVENIFLNSRMRGTP